MLAFVEKLPPIVHVITLLVASFIVLCTGLAHAPLPPKAKAIFTTLGSYFGGLSKALQEADAVLNPGIDPNAKPTNATLPVEIVAPTPATPTTDGKPPAA